MGDTDFIEYAEDGSSWIATRHKEKWSPEETELAMDDTIGDEELAEALERTIVSVRIRRSFLRSCGLYEPGTDHRTFHRYTKEEDEFIASHTVSESVRFIGVSVGSINYRRQVLAEEGRMKLVPRRKFSEEEIEVLKDTSLSNAECARKLNRPQSSISYKRGVLRRLGKLGNVPRTRRNNKYTDEEIRVLEDVSLTNAECARKLNRSESSVSYKRNALRKLGQLEDVPRTHRHKSYTDDEIEVLRDTSLSSYECSRRLNRTRASIRSKRSDLGIYTKGPRSPRIDSRGLYYQSEFDEGPYPSSDELKSWGIKIDRDWDDQPFGY